MKSLENQRQKGASTIRSPQKRKEKEEEEEEEAKTYEGYFWEYFETPPPRRKAKSVPVSNISRNTLLISKVFFWWNSERKQIKLQEEG